MKERIEKDLTNSAKISMLIGAAENRILASPLLRRNRLFLQARYAASYASAHNSSVIQEALA